MYGLRHTVGLDVGVGGLLDGMSRAQRIDLFDQEIPVEGVGVVEIDLAALLHGDAGVVVVIGVLRDNGHLGAGQGFYDFADNGGLAGTGSACDADDVHGCGRAAREV